MEAWHLQYKQLNPVQIRIKAYNVPLIDQATGV